MGNGLFLLLIGSENASECLRDGRISPVLAQWWCQVEPCADMGMHRRPYLLIP